MKEQEELNTFFLTFIGQQVTITTDLMVNTPENSVDGFSVPVFYEGILLDKDNDYYYLGKTPNEISQAVNKAHVVHIMLLEEKNLLMEVLNALPPPREDELN